MKIKSVLKVFLFITVSIFLVSCGIPNIQKETTNFKYGIDGQVVAKYVIDGHEYIGKLESTQSDWATHSATCQHPSHKCHTDTVYVPTPVDTVYCVITPAGTRILEKQK